MFRRIFMITTLATVLGGTPGVTYVFAIDGDVQYSAPYLWVDPETGEISTRSDGPQPKAHPDEPPEISSTGQPDAVVPDPSPVVVDQAGSQPGISGMMLAGAAGAAVMLAGMLLFLARNRRRLD